MRLYASASYLTMDGMPSIEQLFNINMSTNITKKDPNDIGEGFKLVLAEGKDLGQYENDRTEYYFLYKNDIKVQDCLYRKGGFFNPFKDGYCSLIEYDPFDKKSSGIHVIIDSDGEVVMESDNNLKYISHIKGIIATKGEYYCNLKTGTIIAKGSNSFKTNTHIFVNNSYDYKKEFPTGVYKICYTTGEVEFTEG